jgi:hypothetical protein
LEAPIGPQELLDAIRMLPQGPPRPDAKVVAVGVDSLYMAFHIDLSKDLTDVLEAHKKWAQKGHRSIISLGGVRWTVKPSSAGRRYPYLLSSEIALVGVSDSKSKNVPAIKLQLKSRFLWWKKNPAEAARWALGLAESLHEGKEPPKFVLSRMDLCTDLVGIDFKGTDIEEFVMRPRRRTRFLREEKDRDDKRDWTDSFGGDEDETERAEEHWSGLSLSGYVFGRGAVSCRIYDKTREISEASREKIWFRPIWARNGWVGSERVWRVELQLRREMLKELVSSTTGELLNIDDIDKLDTLVGALWTYGVGGRSGHTAWMSWRDPSEAKQKTRWPIREEWRTIQRAEWGGGSMVEDDLLRWKQRAAQFEALVPQLAGLGTTMSALAGRRKDGRSFTLKELDGHVNAYLKKKNTTWDEEVETKRVELAMWDLVPLGSLG